ncbi:MAG TPA: porin [Gemmatales bacterium]|nr:porin [Gemmatales bacterium]HMP59756.1 porin [Gemmatales bacterium]
MRVLAWTAAFIVLAGGVPTWAQPPAEMPGPAPAAPVVPPPFPELTETAPPEGTSLFDFTPKTSGNPTVELGGFFQLDTAWFSQSTRNRELLGDAQDGTSFRSARLWARGQLLTHINYMLELDFGGLASLTPGRPVFQNAFVEHASLPWLGTVRVGRWKQPFSLETATSIRFISFIERANIFAFVPFRRTGVGFFNYSDDERWTWAASAFRATDDGYGGAANDRGDWATAARVTRLLWWENDGRDLFHLGLAHTWNNAPDQLARFGRFPELAVNITPTGRLSRTTPNFFDTGFLPAQSWQVGGLEAAWVRGPFSMQFEGLLTAVDRIDAGQVVFPAWYAYASWFITGEHRPYLRRLGAFDRVIPNENFIANRCAGVTGFGAWELLLRVSQVDVNRGGVNGGLLTDLTFGVNWYLSPHAKMQFNYIHAIQQDVVVGTSHANLFGLRVAIEF